MTDNELKLSVILVLGCVVVVSLLGGILTRVAGQWRDGDRLVKLTQTAWRIRGECRHGGGQELYRGTALFGRLWLRRHAFGPRYFVNLGFSSKAAPLLEGRAMARFSFQVEGEHLVGTFRGTRFTLDEEKPEILSSKSLSPEERIWERHRA